MIEALDSSSTSTAATFAMSPVLYQNQAEINISDKGIGEKTNDLKVYN